MNNETNPDLEAFEQHFLDWLLEKSVEDISNLSVEDSNLNLTLEGFYSQNLDPLDSEEMDCFPSEDPTLHLSEWGDTQGEIPAVSERFHLLLKERLKQEIQPRPPHFPWEVNLGEDEWDYPETYISNHLISQSLWTSQVRHLRWGLLPIPMREETFAELLTSCQKLLSLSLGEGTKLIEAVREFFPQESDRLNHLAGLVLHGALRTPDGEISPYETATVEQKMLLSLLTAQEIFRNLTLTCPLNQSPTERLWETTLGTVQVRAQYTDRLLDSHECSLSIDCQLPDSGILTLTGGEGTSPQVRWGTPERPSPIRVDGVQPNEFYTLSVVISNYEEHPLLFRICPSTVDR